MNLSVSPKLRSDAIDLERRHRTQMELNNLLAEMINFRLGVANATNATQQYVSEVRNIAKLFAHFRLLERLNVTESCQIAKRA